jgi:hypothetical protein
MDKVSLKVKPSEERTALKLVQPFLDSRPSIEEDEADGFYPMVLIFAALTGAGIGVFSSNTGSKTKCGRPGKEFIKQYEEGEVWKTTDNLGKVCGYSLISLIS